MPATAAGAVSAGDADGAVEHFAEAVAMLARLPLSDAERAEAVRRMLAGQTAKGLGSFQPSAESGSPTTSKFYARHP